MDWEWMLNLASSPCLFSIHEKRIEELAGIVFPFFFQQPALFTMWLSQSQDTIHIGWQSHLWTHRSFLSLSCLLNERLFLWQERRLSEKEPIDRSIVSLFFSLMCSFIFFLSQGSWWWTCLCFPFFSLVHHHDNGSISSSLNGISLALHSVRERRDQERGMRLIAWTLC